MAGRIRRPSQKQSSGAGIRRSSRGARYEPSWLFRAGADMPEQRDRANAYVRKQQPAGATVSLVMVAVYLVAQ